MQTVAEMQDTPARVFSLEGTFGVDSVVQEEPFHASPIVFEPVAPTATHALVGLQETAKSLPSAPLARLADQVVPFHCAAWSPGTHQQRKGLQ